MTLEDKILIADNPEVIKAAVKLMNLVLDRHADKLISTPYAEEDAIRLLLHKGKLDGMKVMINEFEQLVTKSNRS